MRGHLTGGCAEHGGGAPAPVSPLLSSLGLHGALSGSGLKEFPTTGMGECQPSKLRVQVGGKA